MMTSLIKKSNRSDRGSISAALLLALFSAIAITAVTTIVLSSLSSTTTVRDHEAAISANAINQSKIIAGLGQAGNTEGATEFCFNDACSTVKSSTGDGELLTLTLEAKSGDTTLVEQITTVKKVRGNYISGYDATGNPTWVTEKGSTPHVFKSLSAGADFSCGIDEGREAWCWGKGNDGQLGNGGTESSTIPVKVLSELKFKTLGSGGESTMCAITTEDLLACWGDNSHRQAGVKGAGDPEVKIPTLVDGTRKFRSLAQSATTTCAISTDNEVWCIGENNGDGKIKSAEDTDTAGMFNSSISGGGQFTALAMDRHTACGLSINGTIKCWTSHTNGSPGHATTVIDGKVLDEPKDVDVANGSGWTGIVSSSETNPSPKSTLCGIREGGETWCWGEGTKGQLGNNTTADSVKPVKVSDSHKFATLALTSLSVCALDDAGKAWCWGDNTSGQLGTGSTTSSKTPVSVSPSVKFKTGTLQAASDSNSWFCAIAEVDSSVYCWGQNVSSQANGDPTNTANVFKPTKILNAAGTTALTTGINFACALVNSTTTCWGANGDGQMGTAQSTTTSAPGPIAHKPADIPAYSGYVLGGVK